MAGTQVDPDLVPDCPWHDHGMEPFSEMLFCHACTG